MQCKFIFITGGVCSSLGKGLTSAAIGMLLEQKGHKVAFLKLDPYLNVDPGTMNPYQHGEVYVTDDGAETDLDLGHYWRFSNSPLTKASNATSGQIFHSVIQYERRGDYLGKTVQVIPHITDEIKNRIVLCAKQEKGIEVVLVEIGGTVGDIESNPFLEAIRQFRYEHPGHCLNIHLTYVPFIKAAGEVKTKPSQHSVQILRGIGLFPDIILCRCENSLSEDVKDKISLFCNVERNAVFDEVDVANTIYEVPLQLHEQKLDSLICQKLQLADPPIELQQWRQTVDHLCSPQRRVKMALVGKYVQHQDAYKSVLEALTHAGIVHRCAVDVCNVEADGVLDFDMLAECDGCLIPGGFGIRGWQGKIDAARLCREKGVPYFGICLGMHVLAVEFARNVMGWAQADSTEQNPETPYPVISLLSEQRHQQDFGGTMRLGAFSADLQEGSHLYRAYQKKIISERHRHRYEFNNRYLEQMSQHGFIRAATLHDGDLCEAVELADHPWMVGVQYHPEFKSKLKEPHPLFVAFVGAMLQRNKEQKG